MKKLLLLSVLLTLSVTYAFGQTVSDSISIKKESRGYQFYQGDHILKMNQLENIMKSNKQAYSQIQSAQASFAFAVLFSFAGGGMIGYPFGTAFGGGEPNWKIAGIGAVLIYVAIPISHSSNKKAKQAVDTYNEGLQTSSFWDKNELKLSMTGNGIGLTLNF